MIEVVIDSIRASLMSQHRVIILRERESDRYLPIWIGPYEAEAINIELQQIEVARPLTHDLLKNVIAEMGGTILYVVVNDLRNDTFYARIVIQMDSRRLEIDSRPSDAIALAVRARVPIYVDEDVMERAGVNPREEEIETESLESPEEKLEESPFRDLIESLDLDDLGEGGEE